MLTVKEIILCHSQFIYTNAHLLFIYIFNIFILIPISSDIVLYWHQAYNIGNQHKPFIF